MFTLKRMYLVPPSTYSVQHINRIKVFFVLKLGDGNNSNLKISQEQFPLTMENEL